jgi:hypothetical protein
MQDVAPPPRRCIGRTRQLFKTALKAGFDHLIKGDVIIKKLKNKHQYRITFSKVYGDRFFFYQVFNKDNTDSVNDQRFAAYIITKNLINIYKDINDVNTLVNKPLFTPTTIMELENFHKHAFVIRNVYFNSHKRLVFMVSTKEIKLQSNTLKKLTQIPSGKFKHVRFDIDAYVYNNDSYGGALENLDQLTDPDNCLAETYKTLIETTTFNDVWNAYNAICNNSDYTEDQKKAYCPMPKLPTVCENILFYDMSKDCNNAISDINYTDLPSDLVTVFNNLIYRECGKVEFYGTEDPDPVLSPKVSISNNNYSMIYLTKDNKLWTPPPFNPFGATPTPPAGSSMVYTFYANDDNSSTEITINGDYDVIHFLCIGGGAGAAASNNSGGGGAGGFRTSYKTSTGNSGGGAPYEKTIKFKNNTTYKITVGNGSEGIVGDGKEYFIEGVPAKYFEYFIEGVSAGYDIGRKYKIGGDDILTRQTVRQGFPSSITGPGVNIISYGGSPGCCNKPSATKPDDYINKDDTRNQQMAGCGGGSTDNNFGKGAQGQGYDGGKGSDDGSIGGGGGGAGGKGVDGGADQSIAGNGGDGIGSDISGTYTVYAAGGSGSSYRPNYPLNLLGGTAKPSTNISSSPSRPGGNGGGNFPPNSLLPIFRNGADGRSNTGSGGGAGLSANNIALNLTPGLGGFGGSGVVILRIQLPIC